MKRIKQTALALICIAGTVVGIAILSAGSMGCEDCAEEGEYCTDLDCCEGLTCRFDQTAGYRCR